MMHDIVMAMMELLLVLTFLSVLLATKYNTAFCNEQILYVKDDSKKSSRDNINQVLWNIM